MCDIWWSWKRKKRTLCTLVHWQLVNHSFLATTPSICSQGCSVRNKNGLEISFQWLNADFAEVQRGVLQFLVRMISSPIALISRLRANFSTHFYLQMTSAVFVAMKKLCGILDIPAKFAFLWSTMRVYACNFIPIRCLKVQLVNHPFRIMLCCPLLHA